MCHFPTSHKGWLRQLHPSVKPKAICRFEHLVEQFLTVRGRDQQSVSRARLFAYRQMGYCHVE